MQGGRPPKSNRVWWGWIAAWTVLGLGIRIGAVLGRLHRKPGGDAFYFHYEANLLAAGKGFINPFLYYGNAHSSVPTAGWPPGFVFVLAAASIVGLKSYLAQRIWCCIIGAAAVVLAGIVGRRIGGPRAGLIAAFLVAIYPNLWMSSELGLSETLTPILIALVLLTTYRFWEKPSWARAAWLGIALGGATLARDELASLAVFIVVPIVLLARSESWRRRIGMLATALLCAVAIVGPWVGYNLTRFRDPVFISTSLGPTIAATNCPIVYSGPFEGYWSLTCSRAVPTNPQADESVQSQEAQTYALKFIRSHEDRLPAVEWARLGRAFAFFRPIQQIRFDSFVETRPYHWALVGLGMYYALVGLSVGGTVILRRRGIPVFPLWAVGLTVAASVLLTFGQTRYRTAFEMSLVLLAGVQLAWFWDRILAGRRGRGSPVESDELSGEKQRSESDAVGAFGASAPI